MSELRATDFDERPDPMRPSDPPPRAARWLLARVLPGTDRRIVLADLAELYRWKQMRSGRWKAALWYWWQVVSFPAHALRERGLRMRRGVEGASSGATTGPSGPARPAATRAGSPIGGGGAPGGDRRGPGGLVVDALRDVRYGIRNLLASPGTTVVALLALTLGIGTITPTFSMINAYFLRPLPFEEPERLVHLWETRPQRGSFSARVALPNFRAWQEADSFASMAIFNYYYEDLTSGETPERLSSGRVSANILEVLGVEPMLGRGFRSGEDQPGNDRVVLLAHDFWRARFDADPEVLGATLELDREPYTIIGVMGPDFVFPLPTTQVWAPWNLDDADPGNARSRGRYQVVARLAPGVGVAQAQAELDAIMARLAEQYPETNEGKGARIEDLRAALNFAYDIFQISSVVLLAACGFVLALACANISSLLLARALRRDREVAIRTALGASRGRLVRQFLTESVLLALIGGALGVVAAYWLTSLLTSAIPPDIYRIGAIDIDATVLALTLLVSVATAVLFGLAPALRGSRIAVAGSLREGDPGSTSGRRSVRLRNQLVAGQIALALLLLVGTSMMLRGLGELRQAELGFRPDGVLTMLLTLPPNVYQGAEARVEFHRTATRAVEALPGVERAATVDVLPLNHETPSVAYTVPGQALEEPSVPPTAILIDASAGYFEVLDVPLLSGRAFGSGDTRASPPVVVINRAVAERHWPGGNPVGREVLFEGAETPSRIVGVVDNVRHTNLTEYPEIIYRPASQAPPGYFRILARTRDADPLDRVDEVRRAIWALDPDLPLDGVRSLEDVVTSFLMPQELLATVLGGLAVGALLLACVGIYGLVSFVVSQSGRELSIRMALGARARDVLFHVLRSGALMTVIGVGAGLLVALGFAWVMATTIGPMLDAQGMLQLDTVDPLTLILVPIALSAVTLLACWVPARRATRCDPIEAMRSE